jgi:quercetin dioxygenase-like cupin family protein
MDEFPDFMKRLANRIPSDQQNTMDVEGYYYTAPDGSQMAIWTAHSDRISKKHKHDLDEYMVVISGQYTAYLDGMEIVLDPGDELFIPKGTEQWGKCIAGTRTIHAFGGERIDLTK